MPRKDPEKQKEYHRDYMRMYKGYKSKRDSFYDFETHRELAMNSGIKESREWKECHQRGFMPDEIYADPSRAFRRK